MLVIEDNIEQTKQIVNYICQNNDNIKLYGITSSVKDSLKLIKKEKADIIILDLKLEDSNGIEIIKQLEKEENQKYKQSIIITSGENKLVNEVCHSSYVFSYFFKPLNFDEVLDSINKIVEETVYKEKIRNSIEKELEKLNFNFTYKGTKYLIDCIYRLYLLDELKDDILVKKIYQSIAKKYNKKVNTIYGNIKHSINVMYYECEEKVLKDYFKYNFIMKPKPREVLYTITRKIKITTLV